MAQNSHSLITEAQILTVLDQMYVFRKKTSIPIIVWGFGENKRNNLKDLTKEDKNYHFNSIKIIEK